MSVVSCTECGVWIDSDKHPECFDEDDRPYCSSCAKEPYTSGDYSAQVAAAMRNYPADADG